VSKLLPRMSRWAVILVASTTPVFGMGGMAVTNLPLDGNFAGWATNPNAKTLLGDFDGDGRTDLALVGVASWNFLPIAFSNNDGSFWITDKPIGDFVSWTTTPKVKILVADFNGDRKADIALTGPTNWATVPVAFSNGDGTFNVQNRETSFAGWALNAAAKPLVSDYNSSAPPAGRSCRSPFPTGMAPSA
jgi:FG-GAP-like repeat